MMKTRQFQLGWIIRCTVSLTNQSNEQVPRKDPKEARLPVKSEGLLESKWRLLGIDA